MPAKFDVKITRQRFAVPGYSPDQMVVIGTKVAESIKARIHSGMTVDDTATPPLKRRYRYVRVKISPGVYGRELREVSSYARMKERRHPPAIRNLSFTGLTLSALQVLRASANRAVIGFVGPIANMRAAINNRRSKVFGVSPRNANALALARQEASQSGPPVRIVRG